MTETRLFPHKIIKIIETSDRDGHVLGESSKTARHADDNSLIIETLGRVPHIDYRSLESLFWSQPSHEDIDLLTIAGIVAFSDRRVKRTVRWSRHLELEIPVHNPDKWSQTSVKKSLIELLNYLTGDHWEFRFSQRQFDDTRARQAYLMAGKKLSQDAIVMPFSGGLDSFSAFASLKEAGALIYLINTETVTANKKHVRALIKAAENEEYSAWVPLHVGTRSHAESTYRTRTFLFMIVAALACKLANGKRLLIPESGQGSLGPCLTRTGSEYPYRGTYPKFVSLLQGWLGVIWPNISIKIEQPYLWNTKAQLLRKLAQTKYAGMWLHTTSCPRNLRWSKKSKIDAAQAIPPQCGVCSNCIQRRVALFNVGLNSSGEKETYAWDNLACESFDQAHGEQVLRDGITENDRSLARWGIFSHAHLAELHHSSADDARYRLVKFDLCQSEGLAVEEVERNLSSFLQQHHDEWMTFLRSLPENSWVRQVARG